MPQEGEGGEPPWAVEADAALAKMYGDSSLTCNHLKALGHEARLNCEFPCCVVSTAEEAGPSGVAGTDPLGDVDDEDEDDENSGIFTTPDGTIHNVSYSFHDPPPGTDAGNKNTSKTKAPIALDIR